MTCCSVTAFGELLLISMIQVHVLQPWLKDSSSALTLLLEVVEYLSSLGI
jgi:hypothetical protein